MLLHIPEVLGRTELARLSELFSKVEFVDGRLSAGKMAQRVKHNEEISRNDPHMVEINNIVMGRLVRHPSYLYAALPHRIATPYYARYTPGMSYGQHIDDPIMGTTERYRSDISITVFLSSPASYQGGELMVRTSFSETAIKLAVSDAILYPSSSLHRVAEVTQGERIVAVTWVQSLVRDPLQRELLYELHLARQVLLEKSPAADETAQVDHAYVNLVRMWSEV